MNLSQFLKEANWPMVIYLSLIHLTAVLGLYYAPLAQTKTLLWAVGCYLIGGIGITGGAHRLWAHRSYSAHWTVRTFLMICNSVASQGTIFHWSRDHRCHHKYSEKDGDPHDATRGFFFAHIGWLLVKKGPEAGRKIPLDDLLQDPVVMFQKKLDPWWNLFWCFLFPAIVAKYFWNENFTLAFLICSALRYCILLHATWTVNSVAHMFGERPYDPEINPRESWFVAIWALGEGWHNWHHTFPHDYATSELGTLGCWNPTKAFIDILAFFGLVWDRKRALSTWEKKKAQGNKLQNTRSTTLQNMTEAAATLRSTANLKHVTDAAANLRTTAN